MSDQSFNYCFDFQSPLCRLQIPIIKGRAHLYLDSSVPAFPIETPIAVTLHEILRGRRCGYGSTIGEAGSGGGAMGDCWRRTLK